MRALSGKREAIEEDDLDVLILEGMRLLKLFYYTCIEHVRSNDGHKAWEACSRMVRMHSTTAERREFERSFGAPQKSGRKFHIPHHIDGRALQPRDPTRAKPLVVLQLRQNSDSLRHSLPMLRSDPCL